MVDLIGVKAMMQYIRRTIKIAAQESPSERASLLILRVFLSEEGSIIENSNSVLCVFVLFLTIGREFAKTGYFS